LSDPLLQPFHKYIHRFLRQILLLLKCLVRESRTEVASLTVVVDIIGFTDSANTTGRHYVELWVLYEVCSSRLVAVDIFYGGGAVARDTVWADTDYRSVPVMDAFDIRNAISGEDGNQMGCF
jgi:hypothetical protein